MFFYSFQKHGWRFELLFFYIFPHPKFDRVEIIASSVNHSKVFLKVKLLDCLSCVI